MGTVRTGEERGNVLYRKSQSRRRVAACSPRAVVGVPRGRHGVSAVGDTATEPLRPASGGARPRGRRLRVERHERAVSSGFTRVTTEIVPARRRRGGARRGRDLRRARPRRLPRRARPGLGLARCDGFLRRLAWQPLFAHEPARPASRDYRRWAFESAALDLALRQAGLSLGEALGLPYRPVRFVVSTRLDIRPWLAALPRPRVQARPHRRVGRGVRSRDVAATGAVRVLDFKAYYEGTLVENPPDAALYAARARRRFPTPIIEDAALDRRHGARRCAAAGAPVVGRADPLLGRRRGAAAARRASSTSSPRASARCARCSTASSARRRAGIDAVRRRPVRARRGPRADPGAGEPLLRRRAQRRGADGLQRAGGASGLAGKPARASGPAMAGFGFDAA